MSPSNNSSSSPTKDSPPHGQTQSQQSRSVPLSAEPGAYKDDGARSVPLSAEGGVYSRDGENEPKGGTAGEKGVSIGGEEKKASSKSKV
ncbi:hypothetical protein E4U35_002073 [Claviceps purpurea]|nr:hypothetical protein E4U38_006090 [Claviceps purpurea]KAG6157119.1 hypothetical protein E4U37_007790 [Claviceps purpurea]KAG6181262.1 hypothetical protein E4U36_004201 [Claviceps purpurea]KAG6194971.1 hypothetical protein E4U10_002418 [Claviceps purpurea]KAG6206050.1 hypothetical protein E4U35_002073 [Claviceps purpurea]